MTLRSIPEAALNSHIGVLAQTGAGKTYGVKGTIIEPALRAGERVCVIDPTGVYWGLRLKPDGKTPSPFKPIIFGGRHADFALEASHGAALATFVGTTAMSSIIDTRLMKAKARAQFFTDFADTLLQANRGPLRLIIDEAHLFAPKGKVLGNVVDLVHATNNLVSLGRSAKLRIVLISQRGQKLHNDSLTQIETLIALRVINPWDRKAIEEWIEGAADKAKGKDIIAQLSSLPDGEGIIWAPNPKIGVLDRIHFPKIKTFDSSSGDNDDDAQAALPPVNLDKVKAVLEETAKKVVEDDPKTLKAKIASLEQQLRARPAETKTVTVKDEAAIAKAEERGFERGKKEVAAAADKQIKEARVATLSALGERVAPLMAYLGDELKAVKADRSKIAATVAFTPSPVLAERVPRAVPSVPLRTPPRDKPVTPDGGDGTLTNPQLALLRALAWWKAMGHDEPRRPQVAAIARWKPTGSNLRDRISELNKRGLIENRGETVRLTPEGEAAAPAPDMAATMIEGIRSVLTGPQLKLFDAMNEHASAPVERAVLAEQLGWEAGGSNLRDRLSELKRMDVVVYSSRTEVQLADWLFATGETLGRAAA